MGMAIGKRSGQALETLFSTGQSFFTVSPERNFEGKIISIAE